MLSKFHSHIFDMDAEHDIIFVHDYQWPRHDFDPRALTGWCFG